MMNVVLDTNIVISSALTTEGNAAKIFEMLILGNIKNYTTSEIINEIKEVMERQKITKHLNEKDRTFIINQFEKNSEKITSTSNLHIIREDPDDDKFINCAITAKAQYIISGDSHLLKRKEYQDIIILTAANFLAKIKEAKP